MVFTHYQLQHEKEDGSVHKDFERLLVLMLKNTDALRFKENLQLNPVDIIDLDKFLQGARIDITRFISEEVEDEDKILPNQLAPKILSPIKPVVNNVLKLWNNSLIKKNLVVL